MERGISYDLNGNIRSLRRLAEGAVTANFQYGYAGNRLITLQDSLTSNSYTFNYDANGNMLHDGANDLDLTYNTSNLIKTATKNDEIIAKYSYLADGTKLSVTDAEENGLYYLGSLVYEKHADTLGLESAEFSNGRFVATTNGVEPRYFVTDHLGSVRLVVDCEGNVIEQDTYYPFGLRWSGPLIPVTDNRYRFNGKEDQTFVGLPFLDYGARMYDPERGRWFTQDRFAEKYYSIGQYNYCADNPVKLIDPTGMSSDEYYNEKGVKIYVSAGNKGKDYLNLYTLADRVNVIGASNKYGVVKAGFSCDNALVTRWSKGVFDIKKVKDTNGHAGFDINEDLIPDIAAKDTTSKFKIPQRHIYGTSFAAPNALVYDLKKVIED